MKAYPHLNLTLILILLFFFPFILKLKHSSLEIYPAIIFPSGASVIKTENDIKTTYSYELYGYQDSLVVMDKSIFLNGIPMKYFHSMLQGSFGLGEFKNEIQLFNSFSFVERNYPTESSLTATTEWLKARLLDQNMKDSIFVLRFYELEYDLVNRNIKSKTLQNESFFKLD